MSTYLNGSIQSHFAKPYFKSLQCDETIIKNKIRIGNIPDSALSAIADSTIISASISSDSVINILPQTIESDGEITLNGTGTSLFGTYINTNVDVKLGSCLINGTFEDVVINSNGIGNNIGGLFLQTSINTASTSHIFGSTKSDCVITCSDDLAYVHCIGSRAQFLSLGKASFIHAIANGTVSSDAIVGSNGDLSNIFGITNNGGEISNSGDCSLILTKIDSGTAHETTVNGGHMSIVMGKNLFNANENCLLMGQYGTSNGDKNNGGNIVLGSNSLQIVGGVDTDATTSNTVMIGNSSYSNIGAVGGGIANFWNTAGADYAEYFEWVDGNKKSVDRSGYFVDIFNKDKIEIAGEEEYDVVGITTSSQDGTSGYTGDCAQFHWKGANDCDNLGRFKTKLTIGKNLRDAITSNNYEYDLELQSIIEDEDTYPNIKLNVLSLIRDQFKLKKRLFDYELSVLLIDYDLKNTNKKIVLDKNDIDNRRKEMEQKYNKLIKDINKCEPSRIILCNPKHDKDRKYIPRSQRQEWIPVGILGKLYVFDNGQCIVGQRCKNYKGIAVPDDTKKGWRVLERVSKSTIRILFK